MRGMRGTKELVTPERLQELASKSIPVVDMAMDAGGGFLYLICKRSHLEISETVIALDFNQLASGAITYIQVAQAIRDRAIEVAGSLTQ